MMNAHALLPRWKSLLLNRRKLLCGVQIMKDAKVISPAIKQCFDSYKKLLKENKRLQAENRCLTADLKKQFREFRKLLSKKPKSN
jgi:hypothetical protein